MSHVLKTRVAETASLTGTGPVTLSAALTAHKRFADVCSVGDTTEYHIIAVDGSGNPIGAWEEGVGTYSSTNTLTRTTVTDSSNAGSGVSFAGSVVVIMTPIAKRVAGLPRGGTAGQVVAKTGSGDFDTTWADPGAVGTTAGTVAAGDHSHDALYTTIAAAASRSSKDANGIWTTVQYRRADNTLIRQSVLSGGTSPQYTTRTETVYAADGTTVLSTLVYTLTYTSGELTSEDLA